MSTTSSILTFDPSTLLGYYQAKLSMAAANSSTETATSSTSSSSSNSATANDSPPWENTSPPSQQARDAQVLGITNYMDLSNVPTLSGITSDAKTEQDNQKLFALYTAVNNLAYLASMSKRDGMTAGQLAGFNTRFQTGLQQVESFVATQTFNNLTLQAATPSSSVTGTAQVPSPTFGYTGGTIVSDANISNALSGVSASELETRSFRPNRRSISSPTAVPP